MDGLADGWVQQLMWPPRVDHFNEHSLTNY